MDPELIKKALGLLEAGDADGALALLKDLIASAAGAAPEAAAPEEAMAETPETPENPAAPGEEPAAAAALSVLTQLTGKASAGEAVTWLRERFARIDTLDADRAALDLSSRRELIANLVELGVEFPSTAWEGDPAKRMPVKRLSDEPLESLRSRIALLQKARPASPKAPRSAAPDVTTLTDSELAAAKKRGLSPEQFAARKANAVRRST